MRFHSILFRQPDDQREPQGEPDFFHDLNLDQIVRAVTAAWRDYDPAPFFHAPLHDLDAIAYRQEVMQDLEERGLMQVVQAFSEAMRRMRARLPRPAERYYKYEKERHFLAAARIYCQGVRDLAEGLARSDLRSRGLCAFRAYLGEYVASAAFQKLEHDAAALEADL